MMPKSLELGTVQPRIVASSCIFLPSSGLPSGVLSTSFFGISDQSPASCTTAAVPELQASPLRWHDES